MCMVDTKQGKLLIKLEKIYIGLREGWVGSFQSACCYKGNKENSIYIYERRPVNLIFFSVLPELLCIGVTCLQAEVFLKNFFRNKTWNEVFVKNKLWQLISSKSGY